MAKQGPESRNFIPVEYETMSSPLLTFSRRLRETPFTSRILAGGAKSLTVYNHTLLPSWFRSLEEDYWHLVEHVQVWDVSCERQVQLQGPDAAKLVQLMTPRDLSKAQDDQCFYVPLCDQRGQIMNDPIAIKIDADTWWLSISDSDIYLWAKGIAFGAGLNVEVSQPRVWPIAVQGPKAETLMARLFGDDVNSIRFFRYKRLAWQGHEFIVARSGWSMTLQSVNNCGMSFLHKAKIRMLGMVARTTSNEWKAAYYRLAVTWITRIHHYNAGLIAIVS
jgi:dimethylsulfoniopropionate demethylase